MTMATTVLKPGDLVTVSITGTVREPKPGHHNVLTIAYTEPEPGVWATVEITRPEAVTVSVDSFIPEHWPPLAGDIWRVYLDPEGHEDWHAIICRDYTGDASAEEVQMTAPTQSDGDWCDPADLLANGPLKLVWRNGKAVV